MDTLLFITDEDSGLEVFLIPAANPLAETAARLNGEEYTYPDEDDEDAEHNEDMEAVVNACFEHKADWHQGNLTDHAVQLPTEPVRVSHVYLINHPGL